MWALLAFATLGQGCVHIYQPLEGLHTPVVVDASAPNFADLKLTVLCADDGWLSYSDRSGLCRKIGVLFENQGARVETFLSSREAGGDGIRDDPDPDGDDRPPPDADLVLELRSRKVYQNNPTYTWVLFAFTSSILPGVQERHFALDATVRDGNGFLLARDSFEGRVVSKYGVGSWVGNKLADATWRDDSQKLSGNAANQDLSKDIYGQLSQLMFNAKMQWRVLRESDPTPAERR